MNKEGIEYLSKYSRDLRLLSLSDLSDPGVLPSSWQQVLAAPESERVQRVLALWEPFVQEWQCVIGVLKQQLVAVDLIYRDGGYSLLYSIQKPNRIVYYEGRNPLSKVVPERIKQCWHQLPAGLSAFYDQLHNGWFYYASVSMGPLPVESWFFLGDEEWGILEELGELDFSLDDMLAVYGNGMGDVICLNATRPNGESILWWHTEAPQRNIDFWAMADSWTEIGLTS